MQNNNKNIDLSPEYVYYLSQHPLELPPPRDQRFPKVNTENITKTSAYNETQQEKMEHIYEDIDSIEKNLNPINNRKIENIYVNITPPKLPPPRDQRFPKVNTENITKTSAYNETQQEKMEHIYEDIDSIEKNLNPINNRKIENIYVNITPPKLPPPRDQRSSKVNTENITKTSAYNEIQQEKMEHIYDNITQLELPPPRDQRSSKVNTENITKTSAYNETQQEKMEHIYEDIDSIEKNLNPINNRKIENIYVNITPPKLPPPRDQRSSKVNTENITKTSAYNEIQQEKMEHIYDNITQLELPPPRDQRSSKVNTENITKTSAYNETQQEKMEHIYEDIDSIEKNLNPINNRKIENIYVNITPPKLPPPRDQRSSKVNTENITKTSAYNETQQEKMEHIYEDIDSIEKNLNPINNRKIENIYVNTTPPKLPPPRDQRSSKVNTENIAKTSAYNETQQEKMEHIYEDIEKENNKKSRNNIFSRVLNFFRQLITRSDHKISKNLKKITTSLQKDELDIIQQNAVAEIDQAQLYNAPQSPNFNQEKSASKNNFNEDDPYLIGTENFNEENPYLKLTRTGESANQETEKINDDNINKIDTIQTTNKNDQPKDNKVNTTEIKNTRIKNQESSNVYNKVLIFEEIIAKQSIEIPILSSDGRTPKIEDTRNISTPTDTPENINKKQAKEITRS